MAPSAGDLVKGSKGLWGAAGALQRPDGAEWHCAAPAREAFCRPCWTGRPAVGAASQRAHQEDVRADVHHEALRRLGAASWLCRRRTAGGGPGSGGSPDACSHPAAVSPGGRGAPGAGASPTQHPAQPPESVGALLPAGHKLPSCQCWALAALLTCPSGPQFPHLCTGANDTQLRGLCEVWTTEAARRAGPEEVLGAEPAWAPEPRTGGAGQGGVESLLEHGGGPHRDRAGSASWAAEPPDAPPPAPGAQWDPVLGLGHRGQRDWCSFHPGRPLAQSQPWVTWCQIPHTKHQPSTDISHDQCPPGPPAPPKPPRPAPGLGLACACTKTSKESATMHQPARRWAAGEGCRERNGAGGSATSLRKGWAACCPGAAHRPPGGRTQQAVETGRRTAAGCRQDSVWHTGPGHRAENEHRAGSYLLPRPTDRPGARC